IYVEFIYNALYKWFKNFNFHFNYHFNDFENLFKISDICIEYIKEINVFFIEDIFVKFYSMNKCFKLWNQFSNSFDSFHSNHIIKDYMIEIYCSIDSFNSNLNCYIKHCIFRCEVIDIKNNFTNCKY